MTVRWDAVDVWEMVWYVLFLAPDMRCSAFGGWWPTRSVKVLWADGREFYYKAGDEGWYDISTLLKPLKGGALPS